MNYLAQGDFTSAESLLLLGYNKFPEFRDEHNDPTFCKELIRLYLAQDRLIDAAKISPIVQSPDNAGWHHILFARDFSRRGKLNEAIEQWSKFVKNRPLHIEARAALARMSIEEYEARQLALPQNFKLATDILPESLLDNIFVLGYDEIPSIVFRSYLLPRSSFYVFNPSNAEKISLLDFGNSAKNVYHFNFMFGKNIDSEPHYGIELGSIDEFCREVSIKNIHYVFISDINCKISDLFRDSAFMRKIIFIELSYNLSNDIDKQEIFYSNCRHLSEFGFFLMSCDSERDKASKNPTFFRSSFLFFNSQFMES